jgi:uncharacterized protein YqeY
MTLKSQIDQDLKTAMLAGDKPLVSVLRGIKSTILNAEISTSSRQEGLSDAEVVALLQKESKKRTEAAELYEKNDRKDRASNERYEQQIIGAYLPKQLDEEEVRKIISAEIAALGQPFSSAQMGAVIGAVKAKTSGAVDGATIARLVKEKL